MLTVKHLNGNGTSSITQTKHIFQDVNLKVVWDGLDGIQESATSGIVYVMNDEGETIAKYDLGWGISASAQPPAEAPLST